ncbi:LADA_0D01002g1_1 [Lachancea dasiensis]|uniref:LADA_0D01002g1_1 n=1 Tax=Lachancea dasiensis TaxID=1072105 RepID=A0A1G4J3U2_9SACH|nr:LADA_0D01002g1_1 [Lachancea dasiensis]
MNNKNTGTISSKKLKQFSTRSRSKSSASFKGLNKLRRVLSHDGSYSTDSDSREKLPMKKSKSSDSLHRRRAISALNMTTLEKVASHPGNLYQDNSSNSSALLGGIKPVRSGSRKLVLELRDGDELYQDHSTTDDEVEYFTDDDKDATTREKNGFLNEQEPVASRGLHQKPKLESHEGKPQDLSQTSNSQEASSQNLLEEGKTLMEEDRGDTPQLCHEDSILGQDRRTDSNKTLRAQPSYGVPSNIRNSAGDHISVDHIPINADVEYGQVNGSSNLVNGGNRPSGDRIDQTSNDDDIILAHNNIEPIANSLRRQGPGATRSDPAYGDNDEKYSESIPREQGGKELSRFSPVMILSQSTGVEKRFDGSSDFVEASEASAQGLFNDDNDRIPTFDHSKDKFNYINNDFASSFNSNTNTQRPSSSSVKPNFSTSISSLSSHLARPSQAAEKNPNTFLHQRAPLSTPGLKSTGRPALDSKISHNRQPDSLSNFNNFSKFLQAESSGTESRTQQKLWLQRESSILDLSSHSSSSDSMFLASNIEVKREFERISREFTNVRRFSNPVTASLLRVVPKNKLDVKKHRATIPQSDELSKVFRGDNSRTRKTFQEFCQQNLNHSVDINWVLTKIWNEDSAEFSKGPDSPSDNDSENSSLSYGSRRSQTRSNLRSQYGGQSNGFSHQRTVGSVQPTTRAVHRRMESALSQQHRM